MSVVTRPIYSSPFGVDRLAGVASKGGKEQRRRQRVEKAAPDRGGRQRISAMGSDLLELPRDPVIQYPG